jgi:uncharacterized protein
MYFNKIAPMFILLIASVSCSVFAENNTGSPWGRAKSVHHQYKPQKVLYDLTAADSEKLNNVLDRVSYLFKLYGSEMFESSIVIVIHGDSIPFFVIDKYPQFKKIMQRANSLTVGTTIEFRMCQASAKVMHYEAKDIHGFVTMVPMADAEIVRLQKEEGYAYMQ